MIIRFPIERTRPPVGKVIRDTDYADIARASAELMREYRHELGRHVAMDDDCSVTLWRNGRPDDAA